MGALIKRYREDQRMTQRELAAAAGMSVGVLRDLEQGRTRSPRWGTLELLAAVLGLGQAQRSELALAWQPGAGTRRALRRPRGLRINVLGPVAAWRGGTRLSLGSARQRAVLGLLALHAGAGVHRDTIIDTLWGERPPASAVAEVQGYVSRLRKALGTGDLLATSGSCYRLAAGTGQLDLAAFRMLVSQAEDAVARSDPARGCEGYEQALGLWRGDIFADVDLIRDHPAAVEATCRRADAVLGYAEAAAGAGAPARALPQLRELCGRDPLNERAHARLMLTLAAAGQQAAALKIFTDLRRRLDAELGIPPSPLLADAHLKVLRHGWAAAGIPVPLREEPHARGRDALLPPDAAQQAHSHSSTRPASMNSVPIRPVRKTIRRREMKLFSMTKALMAAGAVASALAFAVPAGATAHAPAAPRPVAHQVASARAFPGGCSLKVGVRVIFDSKAHGFAVLRCGDTVTNIKVKAKLYRTGTLIARDTNRAASGRNLRAEATRTCVNPDQGIFQAKGRATYDFGGRSVDTGWVSSPPVGAPCGV